MRYAMAATVLAIVGLGISTMQKPSAPSSVAVEAPARMEAPKKLLAVADTNSETIRSPQPVAPFMMVASNNIQPGQIQYGPGPSRLVNFGED
jgi:hypothetical protein